MITKDTVFIIGAGAHVPYGYPSGGQLKQLINSELKKYISGNMHQLDDNQELNLYVSGDGWPVHLQQRDIPMFKEAFEGSAHRSIDAFLNVYNDNNNIVKTGKALIAQILNSKQYLDAGGHLSGRNPEGDWIAYLAAEMFSEAECLDDFIEGNKATFITFNYDTSLEYRLASYMKHSLNCSFEDAEKYIEPKVTHIYGKLPWPKSSTVPNHNSWRSNWHKIITIHEAMGSSNLQDQINHAKLAVQVCENLIMLGCGFHKLNLDILDIPEVLRSTNKKLHASVYEITDAELARSLDRASIKQAMVEITSNSDDCLGFLRNVPLLW